MLDHDELLSIVRRLLGESCWRARVGYGDELALDLGQPVPRHPRGIKGQWVLLSRATPYWIEATTPAAPGGEEATLSSTALEGAKVRGVDIDPVTLALRLDFDNGTRLSLIPEDDSPDEGEDAALATWVLIGAHDVFVQAGPGLRWSSVQIA